MVMIVLCFARKRGLHTHHQMDDQTKYDTLVIYSEGVNSVPMECENILSLCRVPGVASPFS